MRLIIIFIYIFQLFLFSLSRRQENKLSPRYFIPLLWFGYAIVSLIFGILMKDNVNVNFASFLWLYLAIMSFCLGAVIYKQNISNIASNIIMEAKINYKLYKRLYKFILVCSIITTIIFLIQNGISLNVFSNFESLTEMNNMFAAQRYTSNGIMSLSNRIFSQIDAIFTYSVTLLAGGMFVIARDKRDKQISLASFIPMIIKLFIKNTKQILIVGFFFYIISIIVFNLLLYKKIPKITKKIKLLIGISFLIFISALYFSMVLRYGVKSEDGFKATFVRLLVYAFGGIYGYDYFFTNELVFNLNYGGSLFGGIFQIFNKSSDSFSVLNVAKQLFIGNVYNTNIRTVFSQILTDYNILGGILFMFLLGIIAEKAYSNVGGANPKVIYVCILSATYFFFLHGLFSSPWSYSSLIFPYIVLYIILRKTLIKEGIKYDGN